MTVRKRKKKKSRAKHEIGRSWFWKRKGGAGDTGEKIATEDRKMPRKVQGRGFDWVVLVC